MTEPDEPLITLSTDGLASKLAAARREVESLTKRLNAIEEEHPKTLTEALNARDAAHAREVQSLREDFERQLKTIRVTSCEFNLQTDGGCKPNVRGFDNGEVINKVLSRLGGNFGNEAGWVNNSLYLPGGAWHYTTPIRTPHITGLRFRGNGLTIAANENSYWSLDPKSLGGPSSRLVYHGPADKSAFRVAGLGLIWDGPVLQRGLVENPPRNTKVERGSVGIEVVGDTNPSSGKHEFRSGAMCSFDRAFVLSASPRNVHCDESLLGHWFVENCRTVLYGENSQAAGWKVIKLHVEWGCETVLDLRRGGKITIDHLSLMSPALILRCNPETSLGSYTFTHIEIDPNAKGWRLIETTSPWPFCLRVQSGFFGKHSPPGERPIVVGHPDPDIAIDMHDESTGKPWDWRKAAGKER